MAAKQTIRKTVIKRSARGSAPRGRKRTVIKKTIRNKKDSK